MYVGIMCYNGRVSTRLGLLLLGGCIAWGVMALGGYGQLCIMLMWAYSLMGRSTRCLGGHLWKGGGVLGYTGVSILNCWAKWDWAGAG